MLNFFNMSTHSPNVPLWTALALSQRFWEALLLFSSDSESFYIFIFLKLYTAYSRSSCSISLHLCRFVLFLPWIFRLNPPNLIACIKVSFRFFLWLVALWLRMCCMWSGFHGMSRKMCTSYLLGGRVVDACSVCLIFSSTPKLPHLVLKTCVRMRMGYWRYHVLWCQDMFLVMLTHVCLIKSGVPTFGI